VCPEASGIDTFNRKEWQLDLQLDDDVAVVIGAARGIGKAIPGMVKTALNRSVWEAWNNQQDEPDKMEYEHWAVDKIRRVAPLGRWQTAEEVAALAVFLASPRANNITGQTLNVDGGQVMHW
jgi:NAD(P)-dependent dehydrogenase (short-subunit alcohol dehydrogenase family)